MWPSFNRDVWMRNLCHNLSLNAGFEALPSEDISPEAPRQQNAPICVSWCSRVAVMVTIKAITGWAPGPPSCGCSFITPRGKIVIMLYLCCHGNIKGPDGKRWRLCQGEFGMLFSHSYFRQAFWKAFSFFLFFLFFFAAALLCALWSHWKGRGWPISCTIAPPPFHLSGSVRPTVQGILNKQP